MPESSNQLCCKQETSTGLPEGLLAEFFERAPGPVMVTCSTDGRLYLNAEARMLWPTADFDPLTPESSSDGRSSALDFPLAISGHGAAGTSTPSVRLADGEEYGLDTFTWKSSSNSTLWRVTILRRLCQDSLQGEFFQRKINRLKSIVHELRNTLTAAKEALAFLQEGVVGELNAGQSRFVRSAAEDLELLVRAMTDLSSLWVTSGSLSRIKSSAIDIVRVVEQSTLHARAAADRAGISLQIEFGNSLPALVGDHELLVQAIRNVLTNALQHTPPGGAIWIRTFVLDSENSTAVTQEGRPDDDKRNLLDSGKSLVIEVQDSGEGISPDDRGRIFQPFERGRPKDSHAGALGGGGMGLGLTIACDIAWAHGGTLQVRDEPQRGSCFVFRFPLSEGHARRWMLRMTQRAIDDIHSLRVPLAAVLLQIESTDSHASENLLSNVQELAVRNLRPSDSVLAIDSQILLLMRGGTRAAGYAAVDRIMRSLIQMHRAQESVIDHYNMRFGVAAYPQDGDTADAVLQRAEAELHAFPSRCETEDRG